MVGSQFDLAFDMRLLFVLPALPYPPSDGGKMKVFNELKYLSSRHQCELVCLGKDDAASLAQLRAALPKLGAVTILPEPSQWARFVGSFMAVLRLRPPSFARFSSKPLRAWVRAAQREGRYDVIHYDIINMAQYHTAAAETASVHSPNDATSQVYFRLASVARGWRSQLRLRVSAILLRRFERKAYANFSKIHVVSEDDKRYLKRVVPAADIDVIPISSGYPRSPCGARPTRPAGAAPVVTVCGNLGDAAIANGFQAFLDGVLPGLLCRFPALRVRVLGRRISPVLLTRIEACPQVEYHAWVEDFESFLSESDLILVPDLAGAPGAKTRVVQAMALGLAVVGSETGFEGVPVRSGIHGMVYTSVAECLSMMSELLSDPVRRQDLGVAAGRLAADEYSLDVIGPKFEALYQQAFEMHASLLASDSTQTTPVSP